MWSVGSSPLALTTANGMEFSQTQKDMLHRNYIITAWRKATKVMNQQIALLGREKTTHANRMLAGIDDIPIAVDDINDSANSSSSTSSSSSGRFSARRIAVQNAYIAFADLMTKEMIPAMESFQFDAATQMIDRLYRQANEFTRLVRELTHWNSRDRCAALAGTNIPNAKPTSSFQLSYHWYLLTAIVCIIILIYRLLVQRHEKPKLN